MTLLREFIDGYGKQYIKDAAFTVYQFYRENKKLIPKDELEDFQQDIIIAILYTENNWIPSKGKFATYLIWNLRTIKQDIISKYTGIKIGYYQYMKESKEGNKITITMLSYEDSEQGGIKYENY